MERETNNRSTRPQGARQTLKTAKTQKETLCPPRKGGGPEKHRLLRSPAANGGIPKPVTSCTRKNRQISCQNRPVSSHIRAVGRHTRPVSSRNKSGRIPELPPRAHSSLGFTWEKEPTFNGSSLPPLGFDIVQYLRRHGSDVAIRIGQNGEPSTDDHLQRYLVDCRIRQLREETVEMEAVGEEEIEEACPQSGVNERQTENDSDGLAPADPVNLMESSEMVPLSWEDLLKKAKPSSIRQPGELPRTKVSIVYSKADSKSFGAPTHPTPAQLPTHVPTGYQGATTSEIENENLYECLQRKATVMISWRERCVLKWTPVSELQRHHVLPKAWEDSEENLGNEKAVVLPEAVNVNVSSELDKESLPASAEGGFETIPPSLLECIEPVTDFHSSLCIWLTLNPQGSVVGEFQSLTRCGFNVYVTSLHPPLTSTFRNMKVRRVTDSVSVIVLSLSPITGEVKVMVEMDRPLATLFSIRVSLSNPHETLARPETGSNGTQLSRCTTSALQKFAQPRANYCSDKDDEDKLDLRAISQQFPDLKILDLEDHSPNEPKPIPLFSPVHHLLNSPLETVVRPSSRQHTIHVPHQHPPTDRTDSCRAKKGLGCRPLHRPDSGQCPTPTYSSITSHHLQPYVSQYH